MTSLSQVLELTRPFLCTETAGQNPQFHIQIPRSSASKCHVVVSLTQEYDTLPADDVKKRRRPLVPIGFSVYGVPSSVHRLTKEVIANTVSWARCSQCCIDPCERVVKVAFILKS